MDDKTKPDCANCERLRHALKLVNSLRIDAMHLDEAHEAEVDPAILEQELARIEEVLTP